MKILDRRKLLLLQKATVLPCLLLSRAKASWDLPVDTSAKRNTLHDDTNNICCIILVAVSFHVPYYLVAEKLGYLSSFKYETGDISYVIISAVLSSSQCILSYQGRRNGGLGQPGE
jgi:hypothetical protein